MSDVLLDVFVTDVDSGAPIPGAVVLAYGPMVPDQFNSRYSQGDGGCNFYTGPVTVSAPYSFTVIAAGYQPWTTTDQPIQFGRSSVNVLAKLKSFKKPFKVAPRFWKANMCGVRVHGAPPVDGGANDASLILSWLYDRYDANWRTAIRQTWRDCGLTHVLLSWPDSRAFGQTPKQFQATCDELIADGFYVCVFLSSKLYDPTDAPGILANIAPVLPLLIGRVPMFCVGWELSLWLTPQVVQELIDALAPQVTPSKARLYVHFQEGYSSFQVTPGTFADFWNLQIGKLTGVLHQKDLSQTPEQYRYDSGGLNDVLLRFNGGFNCSPDSGFGHPFDIVALEITAQPQFNGDCTQAEGDALGTWAIETPPQQGPLGPVSVMGSGNGLA